VRVKLDRKIPLTEIKNIQISESKISYSKILEIRESI